MNDKAEGIESATEFPKPLNIGSAVARALRNQRLAAGLAIRELGRASGVSSAMISRVENAQVSPSLSTLEALANALSVPVISFFQHTVQTADIHFVKAGEGLLAKRFAADHVHDYRVLANLSNSELKFSAAHVTLQQSEDGTYPTYLARGYVLITVLDGACTYFCGDAIFDMEPGDCLSFDAQLRHGAKSVKTSSVSYVTVLAEQP